MAEKLLGRSEFGRALCVAVGEDPAHVRSIALVSEANSLVIVRVEKFINDEMGEKILALVEKYAWVEDKTNAE